MSKHTDTTPADFEHPLVEQQRRRKGRGIFALAALLTLGLVVWLLMSNGES